MSASGSPVLRFDAGGTSIVGRVRAANEDSYLITESLVAVADGMGGHAAGEVASAIAVEVVSEASDSRAVSMVAAAVGRANERIFRQALAESSERGMGTTLCVAAIVDDEGEEAIAILNVGDSRIYLLAGGDLHQLTEDHSLVETMLREGRLTPEQAAVHPQRNVVTRALGVDQGVEVDVWLLRATQGDRLLLSSDGLFNELQASQIESVLRDVPAPQDAAEQLAELANDAGGRDNITAVVVDVSRAGSEPSPLEGRLRWVGTSTDPAVGTLIDGRDDTATVPIVPPDAVPATGPTSGPETNQATSDSADPAAPQEPQSASESVIEPVASDQPASKWRTTAFVVAVLAVIIVGAVVAVFYVLGDSSDNTRPRSSTTSTPTTTSLSPTTAPGVSTTTSFSATSDDQVPGDLGTTGESAPTTTVIEPAAPGT